MHPILHILAVTVSLVLTACGSTPETSRTPESDLWALNQAPIEHRHVHTDGPRAEEPPPPTKYTCPMHPEIRQKGPGNCPICGMALEPRTAVADSEDSGELVDMRRRFWVAAALTVPLVAIATSWWIAPAEPPPVQRPTVVAPAPPVLRRAE